jgi:isoleucyl-tRNA synthetase
MDYKKTLNLPKTAFPMKANLANVSLSNSKFGKKIDCMKKSEKLPKARNFSFCMTARRMPMVIFI